MVGSTRVRFDAKWPNYQHSAPVRTGHRARISRSDRCKHRGKTRWPGLTNSTEKRFRESERVIIEHWFWFRREYRTFVSFDKKADHMFCGFKKLCYWDPEPRPRFFGISEFHCLKIDTDHSSQITGLSGFCDSGSVCDTCLCAQPWLYDTSDQQAQSKRDRTSLIIAGNSHCWQLSVTADHVWRQLMGVTSVNGKMGDSVIDGDWGHTDATWQL